MSAPAIMVRRTLPAQLGATGLRSASMRAGLALAASRVVAWTAALLGGHRAVSAPFQRWDALHLLSIATYGYPPHDGQQWSFFPLYPLLARSVWIGAAISIAAFWAALVVIEMIGEQELGPAIGRRAVWIAAFFPASLFLTAYYTDGLFLLLSAAAVLAARRDRPGLAVVLGFAAAATRSVGAALAVPLFLMSSRSIRARLLAGAGPLLGTAAFLGYAYARAGDALAPIHAERTWGRMFHGPFAAILPAARDAFRALVGAPHPAWTFEPGWLRVVQFSSLVLAVVILVWTLRRLALGYGAYLLVGLALPLSTFWPAHPLMSFVRFLAVLFPIFLALGAVAGRWRFSAILLSSAALLAIFSWLFGAGMWAG